MTTVVNMYVDKGIDVVSVDRTTMFGNPFRIGRDGTREEVIEKYKEYFKRRIHDDLYFCQAVGELSGCKLGCWCVPKLCHAQVIAEWLNELESD